MSLKSALETLAGVDKDIARAYEICGLPPKRTRKPGFAGLVHIITAQQVSAHAARAIIGRLNDAVRPLAPEGFLELTGADFKAIGLSRQKVSYGRALAEDVLSGRINLRTIRRMEDEDAIAHLTQAKGIGRWSAEVYLLFALKRPDIWPVDDLAVRMAVMKLKRLRKAPSKKRMDAIARPWRPHRSAAARFLWHYYHHPGVPD
ncbi:MAG: DNA-3-methyladenine glycosylase 2 family protein [Rhodospirillales bacterium]|nr:DNA-3-methyladenine glycosylase 2 family protein [Rhodospirillales bacterium]